MSTKVEIMEWNLRSDLIHKIDRIGRFPKWILYSMSYEELKDMFEKIESGEL